MERNYLYWRGGLHQNMLTGDRAADITIVTPHTYTHTHTHTYIYIYISHVRIQVFWVSDY